jgi:hypothetical protein
MLAVGSFETSTSQATPYGSVEGVVCSRSHWQRRFEGDLAGEGQMEMLGVRTPIPGSAGYVGLERVSAVLHGRRGTFCLLHSARMAPGQRSLVIHIVPDSGTGELRHISGSMEVGVEGGARFYRLSYELKGLPSP